MKLDDDDFTLFGLPRRHAVDRAEVDTRWRRLQAEVHPDRFASEGAAAQRVAMQWAVRVNEAHARLKDPVRRGAYLCELAGHPVDAERNTAMPTAFLHQQMEWREALDEASGRDDVEALLAEVDAAQRRMLHELQVQLDEQADAGSAAASVRALMFVNRFRHDVERRLDDLDESR
jgi:molecular chaperone HscB